MDDVNINKLLNLVINQSKQEGNEWLKELIGNKNSSSLSSINQSQTLHDISNDLRRTNVYLKHIDKKLHIEAFKYYKNILNNDLKNKLINDYKEMKVFLLNLEFQEYGRKMINQIESCLNSTINDLDAWSIIKNDIRYKTKITIKLHNYDKDYDFNTIFFYKKKDSINQIPIQVNKIEFLSKIVFCCEYYRIPYLKDWSNIKDLYSLRNAASHGLINEKDRENIIKIESKFETSNIFYIKFFNTLVKSLKILYNQD